MRTPAQAQAVPEGVGDMFLGEVVTSAGGRAGGSYPEMPCSREAMITHKDETHPTPGQSEDVAAPWHIQTRSQAPGNHLSPGAWPLPGHAMYRRPEGAL